MTRLFRFSSSNYNNLAKNQKHSFAQNHALNIYRSDSIYSFIPKNACSTLRTSLALHNGCISDVSDFNWIHKNNPTFKASLSELVKAKYTFTILRCPFSRLASVYLDKIVDKFPNAWNYYDLLDRKIELETISFSTFVQTLKKPGIRFSDPHWRPQSDFLIYKDYDDYFSLENFSHATRTLKEKINIDIIDARQLTKHGTDVFQQIVGENFTNSEALEISKLKNSGFIPSHRSLYNDEIIQIVSELYKEDISLYKDVIGNNIMFS